ncbi:MAG TPA: hypothetical protein VE422_30530 [Terriglobia bacterium]|nr:hypothetical protein [Terriglobia bacterium]
MILYLAGINHFDPLSRERLREWFERISNNTGAPRFLAVEFREDVFLQVRAQRERFRQLLKEQWPQMSEALVNTLVLSLAYEGDTHLEIFPAVEVLWLNQHRQLTEVEIDGINRYAEDRLTMYRQFLDQGAGHLPDDDKVLATISESARLRADPAKKGGDARDEQFAQVIIQRIGNSQDGWAIIVAGSNHIQDSNGSMRRLLENAGHRCEITLL